MTARRAGLAAGVAVAIAAGLFLALRGRGEVDPTSDPAPAELAAPTPAPAPTPPAPTPPRLEGRPAGASPAAGGAPAAVPAAAATGTVVVTVVGEDGTPIPKASVTVGPNEGKSLGPVETGADGVAAFMDVPEGDVSARAKAPSYENGYAPGHARAGETAHVKITMHALVPVTGRVRLPDGTGAVAAIAVVRGGTFAGTTETCRGAICKVAATTSAADGTFRVDVARDLILTLRAKAPGWAAGEAVVRRSSPGEEVVLVLRPGGTVRGVVRAPDGRPCGGARVWLVPADEPAFLENPGYVIGADGSRLWSSEDGDDDSSGFMSTSQGGSGAEGVTKAAVKGKSGADGTYEFEGLPLPAMYRVLADGCGGARGVSADAALSEAARTATADVPLTPRSVLWVRLETPDGQPDLRGRGVTLIGAHQHFLDARGERWSAGGFEKGRAKFDGLLAGTYEVLAEMNDSVPVSRTVDVPAGETVEVAIRGVRGKTLSGVVKDRTGAPVARGRVGIHVPASAGVLEQSAEATTDGAGAFLLTGLQDAVGKVTAQAEGFVESAPVEARAGAEPLALVLRRGAEVRGRLTVPAGVSLPGGVWIATAVRGSRFTPSAKVAPDGTFRLPVDRLDEETTFVLLPRVGAWVSLGTFALASEQVRDLGTIAVEEGRTIRGRVVDGSGAPVAGVVVEADPKEMPGLCDREMTGSQEATSGADGRFAMKGVMRSAVVLRTVHPPFAPTATPQEGEGDAEVVLRRGAFLTGRLIGAPGHLVTGRVLLWSGESAEARPVTAFTDDKGSFTLGPVASGPYTVRLYMGEEESIPLATGTLVEGERKTLELRLP